MGIVPWFTWCAPYKVYHSTDRILSWIERTICEGTYVCYFKWLVPKPLKMCITHNAGITWDELALNCLWLWSLVLYKIYGFFLSSLPGACMHSHFSIPVGHAANKSACTASMNKMGSKSDGISWAPECVGAWEMNIPLHMLHLYLSLRQSRMPRKIAGPSFSAATQNSLISRLTCD